MLWVLIRSASHRGGASNVYPQQMFSWKNKKKYYLDTLLIDLEQSISTWKRAKLRVNIFSTSRLLIDDQSVLRNRWSSMKFWPIHRTTTEHLRVFAECSRFPGRATVTGHSLFAIPRGRANKPWQTVCTPQIKDQQTKPSSRFPQEFITMQDGIHYNKTQWMGQTRWEQSQGLESFNIHRCSSSFRLDFADFQSELTKCHYETTPIQIYWKFTTIKRKFSDRKFWYFFHIIAQNIDCGYSLEPPRQGGSNEYPQSMFFNRNKKK